MEEVFLAIRSVLLTGSIAIALVLALLAARSNPKSASNLLYAGLSVSVIAWMTATFFSLYPVYLGQSLALIRMSSFLALPMTLFFFLLAATIPRSRIPLSPILVVFSIIATLGTMAVTISPYTFPSVTIVNGTPVPTTGPGIILFGIMTTIWSILAVALLIRKTTRGPETERAQVHSMMIGTLAMLGLIILFVFVPVVFFDINLGVAFIPIYGLIFLGMTAYAVVKHQLFDAKVIATEAMVVIIWITLFAKFFSKATLAAHVVDAIVLLLTIGTGILLIKSVRREVAQRKRLETLTAQLETANSELARLDQAKSEFLSIASHQLRTPLTAIKGYNSMLLEGAFGPVAGKLKTGVVKVQESTDRMVALVNDLLDTSRLESGRMKFDFQPIDLSEMLASVCGELKPKADARSVAIQCKISPQLPTVYADSMKIRQVIVNLVDNAIKYSDTQTGQVEAFVDCEKNDVIIRVKDNGWGMSKDEMSFLFKKFSRGRGETSVIKGTGLGLYVAKKLVETHGGRIWAESEGKGKGSVFSLALRTDWRPTGKEEYDVTS
jgi:signal transduction histidine kinase